MQYPLGSCRYAETFNYQPGEKELFDNVKKVIPKEWIWHNKVITYTYNSLGHRNNFEIEDVDVSNMTAIVGCSYIEGVGVSTDFTVSDFYEKVSGEKTYNLGQGGMDNEVIFYNALWAHQKGFKKIIVSWTEDTRNFIFNSAGYPRIYRVSDINTPDYSKYFTADYIVDNPHWKHRITLYNKILGDFGIHTFNYFLGKYTDSQRVWSKVWKDFDINAGKNFYDAIKNIDMMNQIYARDISRHGPSEWSSHYGPLPNEMIARDMIEQTK